MGERVRVRSTWRDFVGDRSNARASLPRPRCRRASKSPSRADARPCARARGRASQPSLPPLRRCILDLVERAPLCSACSTPGVGGTLQASNATPKRSCGSRNEPNRRSATPGRRSFGAPGQKRRVSWGRATPSGTARENVPVGGLRWAQQPRAVIARPRNAKGPFRGLRVERETGFESSTEARRR